MERLTFTVPEAVAARARALAGERGLSAYVAGALEARVGRDEALAALRAHTGVVPTEAEDAAAAAFFGDPAPATAAEPGRATQTSQPAQQTSRQAS